MGDNAVPSSTTVSAELLKLNATTIGRGMKTAKEAMEARKLEELEQPSCSSPREPVILLDDRVGEHSQRSQSPLSESTDEGQSFALDELPMEVLAVIFDMFDLKERAKLTMVCRLFHTMLTDHAMSPLKDVAVLNVFENVIWERSVKLNNSSRIVVHHVSTLEYLSSLIKHIRSVESLKIWFESKNFVKSVLHVVKGAIRVKSVDLYPYSSEMELDAVAECMPDTHGLTMRPHGSSFFWTGLDLLRMPIFKNLNTLCLDSFSLRPSCVLPKSLKTFDYASRSVPNIDYFFLALSQLPELEYLSVSHIDLSAPERFAGFLNAISYSNMPRLQYLFFKFCRMELPAIPYQLLNVDMRLKIIKFDLIYEIRPCVMSYFIERNKKTLSAFSVNQILEEDGALQNVLNLCDDLRRSDVKLHLAIMQKTDPKYQKSSVKTELFPVDKLSVPSSFQYVIARFEGSFIYEGGLMKALLSRRCNSLAEAKFIQCADLNDQMLSDLSELAPQLRKLSIIACENVSQEGLMTFSHNVLLRTTSAPLKVLFKHSGTLATLYGELMLRSASFHHVHFFTKTFPDTVHSRGECVVFRDKKHNKTIIFQNFNPEDSCRILGVVVHDIPNTSEDGSSTLGEGEDNDPVVIVRETRE